MVCASCGLGAVVALFIPLFGTGALPPPSPNQSAQELLAGYLAHPNFLMAGVFVGFLGFGLVIPLVVAIFMQMLRIEGAQPIRAFLQLSAGTITCMFLAVPMIILLVAAYRVQRAPEITQTLVDLGYILFIIPIAPFIVQNVAIAAAILSDRSVEPVYPRWVAWANLFIGLSFVPDSLLAFFKTGPFAYPGAIAFWIPVVTYGAWLVIMSVTTRQAVRSEGRLGTRAEQPEPELAAA